MSEQAWGRFLSFAAWLRAKPSFDAEERGSKLPLATALRDVLEVARSGGQWQDALLDTRVLTGLDRSTITPIPLDLVSPQHGRYFRSLMFANAECVGAALAGYLDHETDPVARFAGLMSCADEAAAAGVEPDPASLIAFGSLFNFAVSPETLPFVRVWLFRKLESILGHPTRTESSTTEYESHLTFASEVSHRMAEADIPVRDMLDVQGLIVSATPIACGPQPA